MPVIFIIQFMNWDIIMKFNLYNYPILPGFKWKKIMKKITLLIFACLSVLCLQAQTIAFPTAEGYGKWATGGRGGEVVEVTNLLDDPANPSEGSLRWAFKQHSGKPITIVFRVSGTIDLKGNALRVNRSNMTIAGQTAPGDGICIIRGNINLGGSRNLIVRHIRSRVGTKEGITNPTDAFIAGAALSLENGGNFIIDHCSFSWSAEENIGFYDNDNTTVQWCIMSEGLYDAGHGKGARSYGAVVGGKTATYHHNLIAHNYNRSPRFGATTKNDKEMLLDYVNNVHYNWGKASAFYGGDNRQGTAGKFQINILNNYYKPGPAYNGTRKTYLAAISWGTGQGKDQSFWHIDGNYIEGTENAKINDDNWAVINIADEFVAMGMKPVDFKSERFDVPYPIKTESAHDAYNSVLEKVGAFPRDTIDRRIIRETRNGEATFTGRFNTNGKYGYGIIDKPENTEGYATYNTYNTITDNDKDGMDDQWELANGYNPNDPDDKNMVLPSGYTVLERYLNSLVGEDTEGPSTGIIDIPNDIKNVIGVKYFDVTGRQIPKASKGLLIEKIIYEDGSYTSNKLFVK